MEIMTSLIYVFDAWTKIMAYVVENKMKMTQEAKLQEELAKEANNIVNSYAWTRLAVYVAENQEKVAQ